MRRRDGELIPEYNEFSGELSVGSGDAITEFSFLTEEDQREWRKEARRREQRRIRPGFRLPTEDE